MTFFEAYGSALVLVVASVLVGRAICVACGGAQRWAGAPMVGLGSLVVVAGASVKLPGHAVTAAVICFVLVVVAAVYVLGRRLLRLRPGDIAIAALSLIPASLPFLANGRIGLPGDSLDDDMAVHLMWTELLRSSGSLPGGYPAGPHSLVAALGMVTTMRLDLVFTGLFIAIAVLSALVGADVVAGQTWWRRAVAGLMCAFGYLVAAYYAEGAFKETLMAGLLLAFVLHLEQVQTQWGAAGDAVRRRLVVPAVLLGVAGIYTYSYLGAVWFAATLGIWGFAEVLVRPTQARVWLSRRNLSKSVRSLVGPAALGVVLVLPVVSNMLAFRHWAQSPLEGGLGNLVQPLSLYESFGVWFSRDFRIDPGNVFHAGQLSVFTLAVVVFGFGWSLSRRRLLLPAAAAGALLIWWSSRFGTSSAYVTGKALVIASPLFIALGLRALLSLEVRRSSHRVLGLGAVAAFVGLAAFSSSLALRNEPVLAPETTNELTAFAQTIGRSRVLFLGTDEFAYWQLHPAVVTTGAVVARPNAYAYGAALDFDSVAPYYLNRFRYVVTSSTSYASQPPANFRLIKSERLYDLWERTGPTPVRWTLEPAGAPGAVLNCSTSPLRFARGTAAVMRQPYTLAAGISVAPGTSTELNLALPPGRWELSLQYVARTPLELSVNGVRWTMPAYTGPPGPFFRVGTVSGRGTTLPLKLGIKSARPTFLTGANLTTGIGFIVATWLPNTRRLVPLRDACGQYVDWYTLS